MTGFHGVGRAFRAAMEIDAAIGGEPSAIHSDAKTSVQRLEARCDRLSLLCEALWTMVRDYGGFKEEELLERINLIDLEDGKLDGKKKTAGPRNCPKCSKAVSPRFHKCMFCSTPIQRDPFQ